MIMFGKTKKMKNDISNLQKEIKYIKDRIGLLEEMFQYEIGNKIKEPYTLGYYGWRGPSPQPIFYAEKNEFTTLDVIVKAIMEYLNVKIKKTPALQAEEKYVLVKDSE